MRFLGVLLTFGWLCSAPISAQTLAERKATQEYLRSMQTSEGGFVAAQGEPTPGLRATSAAIRALKYLGGEPRDRSAAARFVASCFDKETGGFADNPGGKTDVTLTAVGLMAAVELQLSRDQYQVPAAAYLEKHAKSFEEIRIAAAGFEAFGQQPTQADAWRKVIAPLLADLGEPGQRQKRARALGGAYAAWLRLKGEVPTTVGFVSALLEGQRGDGGYGKEDAKASDLEATYRVMRALHMSKVRPEVAKLRQFIARCRNADGGYGVAPGQKSTVSGAYYAAILLLWLETPAPSGSLKVGFAERDITPKIGMEQPGGYGKSYHQSFHDACKVRAVVFDDGTTRAAIVGIDSVAINGVTVQAVRKAIHKRCGIEPNAIMIAASHSHSSGPIGTIRLGRYDHGSALVRKLAYEKSSTDDPGYVAHVEKQLVEAVCAANDSRVESRVGVGKGSEARVAFNRRFRMKSGQTNTHPGPGNPEIVEVAGPTDPEVGVVGAWDAKGKFLGCVVNFACHATTSPGGISANYIYYLERAIRGVFGEHAVVVFVAGASGDVTQVDNLSPYARPSPEKWCQLVGGSIGAEAVKVLLMMEPGITGPVASRQEVLKIERRAPSPERVQRCVEMVQKEPKDVGGSANWLFAKEIVLLDALLQKEPIASVEIQAIQVGPAVFVSNPSEYFCEYGLRVKKQSRFPFTFPVSLANDCVGYVPTEEAFSEAGGGYETRLTSYSNLKITAGSQIAKTMIELANSLTPGKPAKPAPIRPTPSGAGWDYGNVPPEIR